MQRGISSPGVRCKSFLRPDQIYRHARLFEERLFYLLLGYLAMTAYYLISVRSNLVLPSASFSRSLTRQALLRLIDRFKSAYRGLPPPTPTPCPAHNLNLP
ncbi:MAG: hypothetical protein ACK56F_09115 [bacterium]